MREFKDSVTGNDKDDDDLYPAELPPADPVAATTSHPRERDSVS
jgi:hypothetical protein